MPLPRRFSGGIHGLRIEFSHESETEKHVAGTANLAGALAGSAARQYGRGSPHAGVVARYGTESRRATGPFGFLRNFVVYRREKVSQRAHAGYRPPVVTRAEFLFLGAQGSAFPFRSAFIDTLFFRCYFAHPCNGLQRHIESAPHRLPVVGGFGFLGSGAAVF